ncbi:MAG: ABC transporter substrate-binding protein/permease [Roseburia sp.]
MKRAKREFLCLLLAGMALLAFVACGQRNTATGTDGGVISTEGIPGKDAKESDIASADDLEGARIGVQLGTTGDIYVSDYEGDDAGTAVERYNKGADAVQALKQGKIDCVVIDEQPALAFVRENSGLKVLEEEFTLEDYAFLVAKQNDALLGQMNAALREMREEGVIDQIKRNYVGTVEEVGKFPYEKKDVERPNGTLTVATNAEFPPYEYYENGKITGLDMDMMQAVCDKLGMELVIEDMAFDSIISAVSTGKADVGAAGFTVTEDRKKNVNFTDTYTTSKQVIIVVDPNATGEESGIAENFYDNFIRDARYMYLFRGLGNTLIITVFSLIIGIVLGFLIAVVRTNHDRNGGFAILNALCRAYLAIVRGTPVMIQLLIINFVIFQSVHAGKLVVAIIAFGLNSAAYVAEIVRSGIMAVDIGQFEAGRSLGLNYKQTMTSIVLPQAVKNILPALCNEFISLLKETSISGYIGLMDLTKGGDIIRSLTYEAFMPLIAVALIYLLMVMGLSKAVNTLERRLRNNE